MITKRYAKKSGMGANITDMDHRSSVGYSSASSSSSTISLLFLARGVDLAFFEGGFAAAFEAGLW